MQVFDDIEIPNLDGLNTTELNSVAVAFKDLARIAELMAKARVYRQSGNIQQAKRLEQRVDKLYKALPQQIKW